MKTFFRCFVWALLMGFIACLIAAGLVVSCHGQVDAGPELDAIALVEGPPPGPANEGTPWGILPATWALWSKVPMDQADPLLQRCVALAILFDIEAKLSATGFPINSYTVALRWNAGKNARWFSRANYRYARAVQALVWERKRRKP
jgi:hypothetical protein